VSDHNPLPPDEFSRRLRDALLTCLRRRGYDAAYDEYGTLQVTHPETGWVLEVELSWLMLSGTL